MYSTYLAYYQAMYGASFYASYLVGTDPYPCVVVDFNDTSLVVQTISADGAPQIVLDPNTYITGDWEALIPHPL